MGVGATGGITGHESGDEGCYARRTPKDVEDKTT